MANDLQTTPRALDQFRAELVACWRALPNKALFFTLLAAWVALFHFFGNSTLGYTATPSLFGWMEYTYSMKADDEHGRLVPFVVLGLLWWKRKELMALPKTLWWPALLLFGMALFVHLFGYMIQQTRISIVGFFLGVYALIGMVWGWRWLRATFFPICLFAFCVPLGTLTETISFPLRLLAISITSFFSSAALGINVVQDGTRIFDPNGAYQYEVAAACSGLRSLTATVALAVIYAFVYFKSPWRRLVMIAAAFPVAVAANVIRLTSIILAAKIFGEEAGNYMHESSIMSLLPYIPALLGILVLGHWLRENKDQPPLAGLAPAEQRA